MAGNVLPGPLTLWAMPPGKPTPEPLYSAFHINAPPIFAIARSAYGRTTGEREAGQIDALIAIVFAAAAIEAFIRVWPEAPHQSSIQRVVHRRRFGEMIVPCQAKKH